MIYFSTQEFLNSSWRLEEFFKNLHDREIDNYWAFNHMDYEKYDAWWLEEQFNM